MGRVPEILLVDDRRENLFAMETLLKEMDCVLHKALDGDAALALTLDHDFALAIVDVQMPGMDGYELVEFLRANPSTSQIPVIFVSAAYADEQHLFKGYETGAVDYIVKPFEPSVLLGKVRVFLELAQYRFNLENIIQERTQTIADTNRLLKAVADFSTSLLNLSVESEFITDTNKALGRVCDVLGASRVYTLLLRRDKSCLHMCHEWRATGKPAQEEGSRDFTCSELPWMSGVVKEGASVDVIDNHQQSQDIRDELKKLGSENAHALLLVPMRAGFEWQGLIVFEVNENQDGFSPSTRELLKTVGNALTGAISRHETMNALSDSEERFRNVATMNWVWEADARGRYSYSSRKVKDLLGYLPADIIGRSYLDLIEPVMRTDFERELQRQLEKGSAVIEMEFEKIAIDGQVRQMQTSCVPIRDADGSLIGLRGTDKDVTERRAAEQTLIQFKAIFDNASFGAAIADLDGRITYCNRCFAEMHGYNQDELIGGLLSNLRDELAQPGWDKIIQEVLENEGAEAREVQHQRADGVTFPVLTVCTLVRNSRDEPSGIATTAIDLTERKALQEQLQQAQRMESIGRLAGGVAHDFNNMLGVILGQLDIAVLRVNRGETPESSFSEIRNAAERSVALTRQLLAFARIQTVSPVKLNVNQAVSGMLSLLQRLIGENITLDWNPGKGISPVMIDPAQFDQILINLCINARDAIQGSGRIGIEVDNCIVDESSCSQHDGCKAGPYVRLSIDDDGSGMNSDTLQHAFEPFYSTKGTGKGTGLGLATVYGAVHQNGGFIEMTSQPGQGTRCNIYLPHASAEAANDQSISPSNFCSVPGGTETILVVEDEPAYLNTMAEKLGHLGYRVLTADGAEEALQVIDAHEGCIDLLLTDVVMPGIDGKELVRRLSEKYPGIKSLYMSGYPNDIIADHGVINSDAKLLHKPASTEDLAISVRHALGESVDMIGIEIESSEASLRQNDRLDKVPGETLEGLRESVQDGDMLAFKKRLVTLQPLDSDMARYLGELADRYAFEQIESYLSTMEAAHERQH